MNSKLLKDELDKYRRQYDGLVEIHRILEKKLEQVQMALSFSVTNLGNAQQAVDMNKKLMRQMGEEHNKKEQDLIVFMNQLKAKLREMGYDGNFDKLGE